MAMQCRRQAVVSRSVSSRRPLGVACRGRRRIACAPTCALSAYNGRALAGGASNGSIMRVRMAQWLESKSSIDVPLSLEQCWVLWEDRERIPQWMDWIKSVKVQESDSRLSRWTLATHQFGRDWEFSWLARNLAPIKGQKIHWVSEPGSATFGLELNNKGQIRFVRKGAQLTNITLSFSYEVPSVLVPFVNALNPLVEQIISADMQRFKDYSTSLYASSSIPATARATSQQQQ